MEWYQCAVKEACVQDALNTYLGDYPYLDGYSPSQIDVKVHRAFNGSNVNVASYSALAPLAQNTSRRTASKSDPRSARSRGKILPRCACKVHEKSAGRKQVSYTLG